MQVYRNRELNSGNIKWRANKDVMKYRSQIFSTVEKWKDINRQLYLSHRHEHEQNNQMNHVRNIEEMLSGIAVCGANIWEGMKNEKLQRKLDVEQSFIKSKHEVQRIQEEIVRQNLLKRYQFQRFKTQRNGGSLNGSRINKLNNSTLTQSLGFARKPSYFNRLNSLAAYRQDFGKERSDILSRSTSKTIGGPINRQRTNNGKVPIINVTKLDQSHHSQSQ